MMTPIDFIPGSQKAPEQNTNRMYSSAANPIPLGIHYFPDTYHFREGDLLTWLPELDKLGIKYLTLIAPIERAIPEFFINSLLKTGIQPILHFKPSIESVQKDDQGFITALAPLLETYARWGVRFTTFFDHPNLRHNWTMPGWTQPNLAERFLDILLPVLQLAIRNNLIPILPPLDPGGDYWDTAFLGSLLQGIARRESSSNKSSWALKYTPSFSGPTLLESIALSADAWTFDRPVNWGAGGPEQWPETQPYYTPQNSQDQIGFRIFEWYDAIARAVTGESLPIFILRAGSNILKDPYQTNSDKTAIRHAEQTLEIVQHLSDLANKIPQNEESSQKSLFSNRMYSSALPPQSTQSTLYSDILRMSADGRMYPSALIRASAPNDTEAIESRLYPVICVNLWLLSADKNSPEEPQAWYQPDGKVLPVVNALQQWQHTQRTTSTKTNLRPIEILNSDPSGFTQPLSPAIEETQVKSTDISPESTHPQGAHPPGSPLNTTTPPHQIEHYLLLPLYAWGIADWELDAVRPFLQKYHPTLGFSLSEARLARRITIYGEPAGVTPQFLLSLQEAGCLIERLSQDGILLANSINENSMLQNNSQT